MKLHHTIICLCGLSCFTASSANQPNIVFTLFDPDFDIDDAGLPHAKPVLPKK